MNGPTRKLNSVNRAIARLPELSEVERAAMEKMPIKDALNDLAAQAVRELDAALQVAVEKHLGHALTDPEEIRGRLSHVTVQGARPDDGTTYCVDGKPVLWVGPIKYSRDGDTMRADRKMRQLV